MLAGFTIENNDSLELDFYEILRGRTGIGLLESASVFALIFCLIYLYSANLSRYRTKRDVGSFTECSHFNS